MSARNSSGVLIASGAELDDLARDDEHAVFFHGSAHAVDAPQDAGVAVHVGKAQHAGLRERTRWRKCEYAGKGEKAAPCHARPLQVSGSAVHG